METSIQDFRRKNLQKLMEENQGAIYLYGEKKNTKKLLDFIGKESIKYIAGVVLSDKNSGKGFFRGGRSLCLVK